MIQLIPTWFPWAFLFSWIVCYFLAFWSYSGKTISYTSVQKWGLISLRATGLALIILMILSPMIIQTEQKTIRPTITLWVDGSESMEVLNVTQQADELIRKFQNQWKDSLSVSINYFARDVRAEKPTTAHWKNLSDLSAVIPQLTDYNLFITDGNISDIAWMTSPIQKSIDVILLGDTTHQEKFTLNIPSRKNLSVYEGDSIPLFIPIQWKQADQKFAQLKITSGSFSKEIIVKPTTPSGSDLFSVSLPADSAGLRFYSVSLSQTSYPAENFQGTIQILKRIQQVYIFSDQPHPLVGFFQRQLRTIGKTKVTVWNPTITQPNPPIVPLENTIGLILINFPKDGHNFPKSWKELSQNVPLLVVSGSPLNDQLSGLSLPMKPMNPSLAELPWRPDVNTGFGIFSQWTTSEIQTYPPFGGYPRFSPISTRLSRKMGSIIGSEMIDFPVFGRLSDRSSKQFWMLPMPLDEWERWDAIQGRVPPQISLSAKSFFTDWLTPLDAQPFQITFQADGLGSQINTLVKPDLGVHGRLLDSMTVQLYWQNQPPILIQRRNHDEFVGQLPALPDSIIRWKIESVYKGKTLATQQGVYRVVDNQQERQVKTADGSLLASWIAPKGGKVMIHQPDDVHIAKRINEGTIEIPISSVFRFSMNPWIFIFIIGLFSLEWIIRKKLGAL